MLAIMVHLFQRKVELNALKATAISIRTNPAHLQLGTRRIPVIGNLHRKACAVLYKKAEMLPPETRRLEG